MNGVISSSFRWLLAPVLFTTLAACQGALPAALTTTQPTSGGMLYRDSSLPIETRVEDLLSRMTLEEKIGQMTLVENNSITPDEVGSKFVGAVLSGGAELSPDNKPETWKKMALEYERAALNTRLGIPIIFGVDAVHGHGHIEGAVIFPHEIGLGATRDAALVEKIGRATAEEMTATGIRWNYAPVVAVPQDIRWGRTYESYSENTDLVSTLGTAYLRGLQSIDGRTALTDTLTVLATPKHFIGDGGTVYGTSTRVMYNHPFLLDQGDMRADEAAVRELFLPPYKSAVDAGAQSIMVSFSSWQGTKMHAQKYLLTDVLKSELGFKGFLVSDWGGVDQISPDYYQAVVTAINAGLDMNMVPSDYKLFMGALEQAVTKGDVPMARIDDAVRCVLTVKFKMGLFEHPVSDSVPLDLVGSREHRELAREAVQKSLVLLKNENHTLPLAKDTPSIFVAGAGADDIGMMSGGWTITWQGEMGNIEPGTPILQALKQTVSPETVLSYEQDGNFQGTADTGIAVVGEKPYAEGVGDVENLELSSADAALIQRVKEHSGKVIVILFSGRPLVVTKQLGLMDALVAAWLPGTEGQGVADVLFGSAPFSGKLPYTWPRWNSQLPFDFKHMPSDGCDAPLFPFGYGLTTADTSPRIPDCPVQP